MWVDLFKNRISKDWETVVIPLLFVVIVFAFYSLLGYERELQWHSVRKGLEAVALLASVSIVTGCSMRRKLWYPSYLTLFTYITVYPFIISLGRKGWFTDFDFAAPYFLLGISAASLITIILYCSELNIRAGKPLKFIAAGISAVLFLNTLTYAGYFYIYKTSFVAEDMLPILQTNLGEARQFIEGQIGVLPVLIGLVLGIGFVGIFVYLMKGMDEVKFNKAEYGRRTYVFCGVLVLLCLYLFGYWGNKSYPVMEYHMARRYIQTVQRAEKEHGEVVKRLHLTNGAAQALPQKLPGTVIFIIGESENRDHMSAFNPSYPVETTPWLSQKSKEADFILLSNGYANYPQTTPSLEMALTGVNQYNRQKLENAFNIVDIAKAAGYDTWWISNQSKLGDGMTTAGLVASWTDHHVWTKHPMDDDMDILELLKTVPRKGNHFIIIHLGGSHLRYSERVPADFKGVHIAGNPERTNDYDNTVLYSDHVMKALFDYAQQNLNLQAFVYSSDHGEDMVYSHGAGKFTYDMVRIPVFFYLSPDYMQMYAEKVDNLQKNKNEIFTNDLLYDTISGMIAAENGQYEERYDLFSNSYTLSLDMALTKHGQERIDGDDCLKLSGRKE